MIWLKKNYPGNPELWCLRYTIFMTTSAELRQQINGLITQLYQQEFEQRPFEPGVTPIPASGKVFTAAELQAMTGAVLDGWWTSGPIS